MKHLKLLVVIYICSICILSTNLFAQMTWTQTTANAGWSARNAHASAVFDNKMWVMGGCNDNGSNFYNDVWYSSNGVNWTEAAANAGWSARSGYTSVIFDNEMWVMGGFDLSICRNDVWYSTDGMNWTQATANAGWSARFLHTSVVFDNKMWVMGGFDLSNCRNDVWYSTDGVNWTQTTANAGWSARFGHTSVMFDNKMWVIGGGDNNANYKNDIWYSSDGVSWTQATANAGWSARIYHTSVVFDNNMWAMGGNDGSNVLNDVWYSIGLNGIEEENHSTLSANRLTLEVYPNPAKTFFNIRSSLFTLNSALKLYDVTGNMVKSTELKGKNNRMSLDGIKNGVYFVQVGDEMVKEKLVITK